ncbi:MAG: DNA alkylation repair protein [Gaiellaceae bacterium]|jgi:3-methyladenine DNA glycosylase AlkD
MPASEALISAIRDELEQLADPERAPQMQAYLKSELPCLGVTIPLQRKLVARAAAKFPIESFDDWRDTVRELWSSARHREELTCAVHLLGVRRYRAFQSLEALPLYEELIVRGAWWDLVDDIATHRLGPLLVSNPDEMRVTMRAWSRDRSLWKRRSSIICQVTLKEKTDRELLFTCIEANLHDRDFFIRKAIGWALRSLVYTDPDEVVRYVRKNESRLSPLSRREALKNIPAS